MIEAYTFGSIKIAGRTYTSDITITSGHVKDQWWRASGHSVSIGDIKDILAARPAVLVLGTGSSGMLRPADDFSRELEKLGITLIAKPTRQAIDEFNRLHAQGEKVAAGFHLTC